MGFPIDFLFLSKVKYKKEYSIKQKERQYCTKNNYIPFKIFHSPSSAKK